MLLWFLGTALGNKLAGVVAADFNAQDPQALAHFFWQQALMVAGLTALLLVLVPLIGDSRNGARRWIALRSIGVSMLPGAMPFTRMPLSANSIAAVFVSPTAPCFEAV